MSLRQIIETNLASLNSIKQQLNAIDTSIYIKVPQPLTASSIGAHVRHIIEHYECFFHTIASGKINYDHRARVKKIEHHPKEAIEKINLLYDQLQQLLIQNYTDKKNILFKTNLQDHLSPKATVTAITSLARELLILHSHTIHHLAYIAILLRYFGLNIDASIGKAPSTLLHEAST